MTRPLNKTNYQSGLPAAVTKALSPFYAALSNAMIKTAPNDTNPRPKATTAPVSQRDLRASKA